MFEEEKIFFWIFSNFFFILLGFSVNSTRTLEGKICLVCRNCNLRVQMKFLRKKTFSEKLFLEKTVYSYFFSDMKRLLLEYLAKKLLVRGGYCQNYILHVPRDFIRNIFWEKCLFMSLFWLWEEDLLVVVIEFLAALPNLDSRVQKTILRKKIVLENLSRCSCILSEDLRSFIELLKCFWESCQNCSLGFPRKTMRRFVNLQKNLFLELFEIRTSFFSKCYQNCIPIVQKNVFQAGPFEKFINSYII